MRYTNALILRAMARAKTVMATPDEGATAVEYGLMVGLIAAAIIVTVGLLGTNLNGLFDMVSDRIDAVTP